MPKHCILSLKMNKDFSFFKVRKYKLENHKNITINHLNANSLRNKFFLAEELIKTKLDIFLISKTKTDHNFPISSFQFMDIKCIRKSKAILVESYYFIWMSIPYRELTPAQIDFSSEIMFLEITLPTQKWLITCL